VNTTHPYQPGYLRPDPHPDDSYQPFQVTARAVATGDTAAERAHSIMVNALDGFKKHIEGVTKEQHRWSAEGFREQIAGFANTDAVKAVDAAVAQVKARRDEAAAKVDKVPTGLAPNGDTAADLPATRHWNRTKSLLDSKEGSLSMRGTRAAGFKACEEAIGRRCVLVGAVGGRGGRRCRCGHCQPRDQGDHPDRGGDACGRHRTASSR
jgi:hypothetical protein